MFRNNFIEPLIAKKLGYLTILMETRANAREIFKFP